MKRLEGHSIFWKSYTTSATFCVLAQKVAFSHYAWKLKQHLGSRLIKTWQESIPGRIFVGEMSLSIQIRAHWISVQKVQHWLFICLPTTNPYITNPWLMRGSCDKTLTTCSNALRHSLRWSSTMKVSIHPSSPDFCYWWGQDDTMSKWSPLHIEALRLPQL